MRHYLATHANFQALADIKRYGLVLARVTSYEVHANAVSLAESCAEAFSRWEYSANWSKGDALIG